VFGRDAPYPAPEGRAAQVVDLHRGNVASSFVGRSKICWHYPQDATKTKGDGFDLPGPTQDCRQRERLWIPHAVTDIGYPFRTRQDDHYSGNRNTLYRSDLSCCYRQPYPAGARLHGQRGVAMLNKKHKGGEPTSDNPRLRDDLGADWLDRLGLMIAIEDQEAGIAIDEVVVDQLETVGDPIRALLRRAAARTIDALIAAIADAQSHSPRVRKLPCTSRIFLPTMTML